MLTLKSYLIIGFMWALNMYAVVLGRSAVDRGKFYFGFWKNFLFWPVTMSLTYYRLVKELSEMK